MQYTLAKGANTCGRKAHDILEFGDTATALAAVYPERLCYFIGDLLVDGSKAILSAAAARSSAVAIGEGKVKNHILRVATEDSAKDKKRAEDEKTQAGMRNPASVCKEWPSLVEAMRPVQEALLAYQRGHP
jgi:hypothetical protein